MDTPRLRALGVSRISQEKDPDQRSYADQRAKMQALCQREDWALRLLASERSVSGGHALSERPSLLEAVQLIEAGHADVLVVGYKDRLDREPAVRDEVIDRVEAAGGMVWTGDHGRDTNGTAVAQFSGTVLSAAGRMMKRQAAERSYDAVAAAIAEGIVPWPNATPGYRKDPDGRLVVHKPEARVVSEAFALRAAGESVTDVRAFLARHGIDRSFNGTQSLLKSRVVLGEIHFGTHVPNLAAHPAIVELELWQRVRAVCVSRGRRAKSERLLARIGVLRCGTCGARMVVGSSNHGRYALYRCPTTSDCVRKATISAQLVEDEAVKATRRILADVKGRASRRAHWLEAKQDAERAQALLDALIELLDPLEPAARQRLQAATTERDLAMQRRDRLRPERDEETASVEDWDSLRLVTRRALVRSAITITILAGRGPDRIKIEPVS